VPTPATHPPIDHQTVLGPTPATAGFDATILTVGAYLARWLQHAKARVRPTTYDGYHAIVRCHTQPLSNLSLSELHPLHLQQLYTDLQHPTPPAKPLSAGSVLNVHLLLTQALGQAVRWQILDRNPAHGAQPPRPQRPAHTVADPQQLHHILQLLEEHPLELPYAIAIATGMRRGELLALRWHDLTPDYTTAHIQQTLQATRSGGLIYQPPKTHRSQRAVALPAFLTPRLETHRAEQAARREAAGDSWHDHDLINDNGDGQPINPDTLSSAWRRFRHQHQLPPLRFHDLRHSHATLMLIQGIHPKIVSERLGHASINITLDTYTHILPTLQHQAANAFDQLFPTGAGTGTDARPSA